MTAQYCFTHQAFTVLLLAPLAALIAADRSDAEKPRVTPSALAATETAPSSSERLLVFSSSSSYLAEGFAWARRTALSKVHPDNGGCYQAALQDRGGYCQRDYVHQIDGAALLGLHRENLAMLRCFATNQSKARGWFSLWKINDTWYDAGAGRYLVGFDHPGCRPVNAFGYETSWFIPYTGLCEAGPHATAYLDFIHDRFQARPSRNIEAWTYLPDVFYAWNQNERGWRYFKRVLDSRSSYPEVSFTVISHIATRIMGIEPDAPGRSVSTLGRLPAEVAWAQLDHVPVGPNDVLVRHEDSNRTTTVMNHAGPDLMWEALFPGAHSVVLIDGSPKTASTKILNGAAVSSVTIQVRTGQRRTATTAPAKKQD